MSSPSVLKGRNKSISDSNNLIKGIFLTRMICESSRKRFTRHTAPLFVPNNFSPGMLQRPNNLIKIPNQLQKFPKSPWQFLEGLVNLLRLSLRHLLRLQDHPEFPFLVLESDILQSHLATIGDINARRTVRKRALLQHHLTAHPRSYPRGIILESAIGHDQLPGL